MVGWQLKKLFFVIYRIFSLRIVNSKLRRHFLDFAKHEVEIPIYTTNTLTKYPKYYFDTSFDVHSELWHVYTYLQDVHIYLIPWLFLGNKDC